MADMHWLDDAPRTVAFVAKEPRIFIANVGDKEREGLHLMATLEREFRAAHRYGDELKAKLEARDTYAVRLVDLLRCAREHVADAVADGMNPQLLNEIDAALAQAPEGAKDRRGSIETREPGMAGSQAADGATPSSRSTSDSPGGLSAKVLLWSGEHKAYWRDNRAGYTTLPCQAGHYNRADALDTIHRCSDKQLEIREIAAECGVSGGGLACKECGERLIFLGNGKYGNTEYAHPRACPQVGTEYSFPREVSGVLPK